jgi:hypothetical protein
MNRKTVCWFVLVLFAVFSAYSQAYDDENDFRIAPLDGGRSAMIIRYTGNKTTVRIPPKIRGMNVIGIGVDAFRLKKIVNVTIPNSVTYIGDSAFNRNDLKSLIIPNSVTYIGDSAFFGNELTSVTIPNSVTSIGTNAFYGNDITSVNIPNSVTYIGHAAFLFEYATTRVTIGSNVIIEMGDCSFKSFYDNNGKRAGTYTFANGRWSMR